MKALLISLVLLSGLLLIPQAKATSTTKYPTETSVIVAGWNNPTNAYSNDGQYAATSTNLAQQEYSGFGFNLNATDTIDQVSVNIEFIAYCDVNTPDFFGMLLANLLVYDNSSWRTYTIVSLVVSADGMGFASADDNIFVGRALSVLNHVSTPSEVNALKIRLQAKNTGSDPSSTFSLGVDFVGIEVAYTIEVGGFYSGFLFGGVLCGLVAVAGALILEKKD